MRLDYEGLTCFGEFGGVEMIIECFPYLLMRIKICTGGW